VADLLDVPVVFLGRDADLARRLAEVFAAIPWDPAYRIRPVFRRHPPEEWARGLPAKGRGLALIEIAGAGGEAEMALLAALRERNAEVQVALLAEDDVDYFRIAETFRIGNVIKKGRFDGPILQALTIRLLTGNIFGFEPYFPGGYTVGPLHRTYAGQVAVEEVIREAFEICRPYVHPEESGNFRMFLHELLTNTFAYAIEGISPEDRDTKLLGPRPETFINEHRAIKVSLAADAEKVGFAVMDSTGSLSLQRILQKLRRQSKIAGEKLPPGIWDESGRGMSLVYRYSRLVVNILSGVRTETIFLQYRQQDLNRFESIIVTEVIPFWG
jgi:hypothetical protein